MKLLKLITVFLALFICSVSPAEIKDLSESAQPVTAKELARMEKDFNADPTNRLRQNALTKDHIDNLTRNYKVVTSIDNTFSHKIDDWEVTNQKHSGRCWMFAGMNFLRAGAIKKMNIENFEFSQSYVFFWDKFERSNYLLEAIIDTADRPDGDRVIDFLLSTSLGDGGQWNMFVSLVKKHGLVPKSAMPESFSSSNSRKMNLMLRKKLHEGAMNIRKLHANGADIKKLRQVKKETLTVIYRMLCIHMGTPPEKFIWQWRDKDNNFHRDGEMTPKQFAEKYVTVDIDEYVCLVNDPRETSPMNRTMTIAYLGNVVGGDQIIYLNVDISLIKELAMKTIMDGEPVWFGCDSGKKISGELGLWDDQLYDYESAYGTDFPMTKAQRMVYHISQMVHAMVFTGVDVLGSKPRKWRVENSWSEKRGLDGFYILTDKWFDEYVFEVAIKKSMLSEKLQNALKEKPIVLPPWDPMGALALSK